MGKRANPSGVYQFQLSSVQTLGWWIDRGDEKLPNYMGIIISQYKDPYKPISITLLNSEKSQT